MGLVHSSPSWPISLRSSQTLLLCMLNSTSHLERWGASGRYARFGGGVASTAARQKLPRRFAVAAGVCALVICLPRIVCGEAPHSSPDRTAYFRQLLDTAGTGWPCATAAGSCPFARPCAPCTPCDQGSGTWPLQAPASGAPEAAASWWSGQPAQQFTGFTRPVPRPRARCRARRSDNRYTAPKRGT